MTSAPSPDAAAEVEPTQSPVPPVTQTVEPAPAAIIARASGGPDSFLLVGGSQAGAWINAAEVMDAISEDTEYQLYTAEDFQGWFSGGSTVFEHLCGQSYLEFDSLAVDQEVVGLSGRWPVVPRPPQEIPLDTEVYLEAVAGWLVDQAPSQPVVAIDRIWRVDLEGNGTQEVLISATRFAEATGHDVEPRDYSVVLLRTVVGSDVATIPLVGDHYAEAAQNRFPLRYHLDFVGDLNGDGQMEVVVGVTRWEGRGVLVFEVDGQQVQLVLSVMCSL